MAFSAENLNLLEKVRDFRVCLALLAFAALLDVFLVAVSGSNLWTFKWNDVTSRPGVWLLLVLAYSVIMTLGAAAIATLVMVVLGPIVRKIQSWLDVSVVQENPDPQRYVHQWEAGKALAHMDESVRPKTVEKQLAERAAEVGRWHALVGASWVGVALVALDWNIAGSGIAALAQWHPWAPWLVLAVPAWACAYHMCVGVPGHDFIDWPEHAKGLARNQPGAFVPMPSA